MGHQSNRWRCVRCRRSFVRPPGSDSTWCNPCVEDSLKEVDAKPIRAGRLLKYGITRQSYETMVTAQAGVCAICHLPPPLGPESFAIDHNHDTGKVRGLLCPRCNSGLGFFGDNPDLLMWAAVYLKARGHVGRGRRPLTAAEKVNGPDLRKQANA